MNLTKLADNAFFNVKRNERERVVQEGVAAEELQNKGTTLQDLVNDARKVLEIDEDESVMGMYEEKLKLQNVEAQAFINLVNSISKMEATGILSQEQVNTLREAEDRLAEKLANRYGVDVERLYMEEELGEDNE